MTEAYCNTMKVQMRSVNFHPSFVLDIANMETAEDALQLMFKYGTHYYKSATLGGKLTQVSVVDKTFESASTEDQLRQQSELSFGGAVSAPVFSASVSYTGSSDSDITEQSRSEYESSSSKSTVITHGGAPGAFAPESPSGYSAAPSTFGGMHFRILFSEKVLI
jgi:hypothetical protein